MDSYTKTYRTASDYQRGYVAAMNLHNCNSEYSTKYSYIIWNEVFKMVEYHFGQEYLCGYKDAIVDRGIYLL